MTVSEFAIKHSLKTLCLPDDREITGGYVGDLLSWVMGRAQSGDAWITIMSNQNILAVATLADVSCIILGEGVTLDEELIKTANDKGINVLASEADTFKLSAMLACEL
ncbi:MAG: hypothetical protein IJ424_02345 [Oscillospiraceae bacterium]|nr:hypothetical protein [Oscillospiraceae bacterium]